MFKRNSVPPQAAAYAQKRMEIIQSQFESKVFSAMHDGVTVSVTGTRKLQSISGADPVSVGAVMQASELAYAQLEYERNLMLVQLRNEVQKMHRVDIKTMVPDIAAAVLFMEQRQSLAS
jgi:DNA-binding protein YbaB